MPVTIVPGVYEAATGPVPCGSVIVPLALSRPKSRATLFGPACRRWRIGNIASRLRKSESYILSGAPPWLSTTSQAFVPLIVVGATVSTRSIVRVWPLLVAVER